MTTEPKLARGKKMGETTEEEKREKDLEYQKKYYSDNRDKLARQKAEKYANDPEYKRRQIEGNKARRAKRRALLADKKIKREKAESLERWKDRKIPGPRIMQVEGTKQVCHSKSDFARYIGRSNETVRRWLTNGVLPGVSAVVHGKSYWSAGLSAGRSWRTRR